MAALAPGEMVTHNVRLVRQLGEGGMGTVWIADHLGLDTQVAVKFISAELVQKQPALVTRFRREAAAAAKIKSPHVVQVFDYGVMADGTPFMVMELLQGQSLGERLERVGTLSLDEIVVIVTQVAKALTEAHERGVIHRDIKPDNIFLTQSAGELIVKVLDFGIARHTTMPASDQLTGTRVLLGTPEFMSPEQILSAKSVDLHADLWALAVVAYQALTGHMPFDGETLGALIVAISGATCASPSALGVVVPPAVDAWFARAFAKNPDHRFGSAKELAHEFRGCVATRASSASSGSAHAIGQAPAPSQMSPVHRAAPPRFPEWRAAHRPGIAPTTPLGPVMILAHGVAAPAEPRTFSGAASTLRGVAAPWGATRAWLVGAIGAVVVVAAGGSIWLLTRQSQPSGQPSAPAGPEVLKTSNEPKSTQDIELPESMVVVPAGQYVVGCPDADADRCFADEKPAHRVTARRFAITRTEVTVDEYAACVEAGRCGAPKSGDGCTWGAQGHERYPVTCVSWDQARTYCTYSGWGLPTEEQWEIAARGRGGTTFPWGDEAPSCALGVFSDAARAGCGSGGPLPVGSRQRDKSWVAAFDMGGNVREWTASDYVAYPGGTVESGVSGKVNRGGSWVMKGSEANTSHTRVVDNPKESRPDLGFRCALELEK